MKKNNNRWLDYIGLNLVGGAVGVNQCNATDMTWYCQFSRFFSTIMMVITIFAIIYVLYILASVYLFKKSKK